MSNINKWTKDFSKDMLLYGVMSALSRVTGLLLLPFLTRFFSTSEYGVIDVIAVARGLLATLACMSLMNSVYRYFHQQNSTQEKKEFISSIYAIIAIVATGIIFIGVALKGVLSDLILGDESYGMYLVMAFVAALFYSVSYISEALLRIERKIVKYNLLNIVYSVSYALLIPFFLCVMDMGLMGVFLADIVAIVVKFVMGLFWSKKYLTLRLSPAILVKSLRFSLPILPADLINWVSNQIDRFVLLYFLGLSSVGILGAAMRIAVMGKFLTTIFRQAWAPYSMSLISADAQDRDRFYQQALLIYAVVFSTLGLVLTCFSSEMFRVLVPVEYYEGHVLMPWIVGAATLEASRSITSIGVSISERTHLNTYAAIIGVGLNILLALILIPSFGLSGAAIGSFVSQLAFTGSLIVFSMRNSEINFQPKRLLCIVALYLISATVINQISEARVDYSFSLGSRVLLLLISSGLNVVISGQSIRHTVSLIKTHMSKRVAARNGSR